jgi:hypothetical protein
MAYNPEISGRKMTRGQLTKKGYDQHKQLGRYLRRRYIDEAQFLPDIFANSESLFFRSTQWERTIESLQVLLSLETFFAFIFVYRVVCQSFIRCPNEQREP